MTPVVFIHWGDLTYLQYAWNQSEKYNNRSVSILDKHPVRWSLEVARWYHLRDFMKQNNHERVAYFDSDVLLFKNVDKDFRDCDAAISRFHSGHTMFVNNVKFLEDFCEYVDDNIFFHPEDLVDATRKRIPDGVFADSVGDMVLLNNFVAGCDYVIADTASVRDNSVYDHNINLDNEITIINEVPCYFIDGQCITYNSLHFQGDAKKRMKGFVNG